MVQLLNSKEVHKLLTGESFKGIFVVKTLMAKTDKNGHRYYEMSVIDPGGSIDAKVWSDASWFDRSDDNSDIPEQAKKLSEDEITNIIGKTVGIDGKTADYRGQQQYNFNKITLLNQNRFPSAQYLPHSPIATEVMEKRFEELICSCRDEIADFLRFVFKDEFYIKFRDWPAAVNNHHAYANGLLEHTVSVADCAKSSAEALIRSGYPVDIDVVVAGALLHDIGKMESYKIDSVPEITLEGAVIDHVALGYAKFLELANEAVLDPKLKLELAHIILSHHGIREFGSPIMPETPEAMIVASADELDFRMFCWNDSVKDMRDDENISAWNNPTQRRFWNR
jgi:3'-5' exoribonuclease